MVWLIERFHEPLRGAIKIDGRDMQTYNRSARSQLYLQTQSKKTFSMAQKQPVRQKLRMQQGLPMHTTSSATSVMDMTHGAVREVFSCHPEEPQISFTG
jgi:hypothetical protein